MIHGEIDIGGVLVPGLLAAGLVAGAAIFVVRGILARAGLYRLVWHRNLFDLALYVILISAVVALMRRASF